MNHTPAPWIARTNHVGLQYIDANGYTVASFDGFRKVAQPDANLIAAAPELLNALERYFSEMEIDDAGQRDIEGFELLARAAIAKATGKQA